jgi:F-type H+-transporting ATPase subunit gamma
VAGGQERVLKRRIKSVQSTKKITRAMELIAASRIVKAQQRVLAARPYSERITEVIRNLSSAGASFDQPLLTPRAEVRRVGYVVITADRGLAGGYNSNVIRAAENGIKEQRAAGRDYALYTLGKKGLAYFKFRGFDITSSWTGGSEQPVYEDARAVAADVMARFDAGEVDQVELVYTQFLSVGTQRVTVRRLMPLDTGAITETAPTGPKADYEYEPEPTSILERLLPRYVEARIFAAMLDAAASEHAARQRAMKSATDNAEELIKSLTRVMNRARQESITTEIMEIVGGAEALSQAGRKGAIDLLVDTTSRTDLLPDTLNYRTQR